MNHETTMITLDNSNNRKQIALIDTRLIQFEKLAQALAATMEVVLIDGSSTALETVLNALPSDAHYDAIHLFTHGGAASLQLGDAFINSSTLHTSDNRAALEQLGGALKPSGDLLIYACDLAQGSQGLQFIEDLAQLTHAKVSASTTTTGASLLGGDWNLEVTVAPRGHLTSANDINHGLVAPVAEAVQGYSEILANVLTASANVTVATGHDFLSATPGTTPLNVQGAVQLSNGSRVVLLANTHNDYYGMANLDHLKIAVVDTSNTVTTTDLGGTVANVINNNGGHTNDASFTQTNDTASITALTNGFVVTTASNDGYGVQMYSNAGVSQNISAPANYTSSENPNAYTIATNDGGFILLWTLNNYQTLDFQRYNSSGVKVGATISSTMSGGATPYLQGAAVDESGNVAIPLAANDVYTKSQVMLWDALNAPIGTFNTAYYQAPAILTAMYGGGFDMFGNDITSGVGNTSSNYYVQSLAIDGSTSQTIASVIPVATVKSVQYHTLSGNYFVVGGADSSVNDGYFVDAFNPSAGTTYRNVNDPSKLVVTPTLSADGNITGAWATDTTVSSTGFITDGTIATVSYSAAYTAPTNMPPTITGMYTNNGAVNDDATITPFIDLTINDVDDFAGLLYISYPAANGTLSGEGLTGTAGNYTLEVNTASFAMLSSELRSLVFHPTANQVIPGGTVATNFSITPSDGDRSGRANTFTNVTATSINDAPVIDSDGGGTTASINAAENQTTVTTAHANDPDFGAVVTYSLSGTDAALFTLNSKSGVLTFNSAPNFETPGDADHDNVYKVTVTASDGSLSDTQDLSITVTDVNEAPVISSNGGGTKASISVAENQTAVTKVVAADVDANTTLTYSVSGTDASFFTIDSNTGVLTFKQAPDYEQAADAGNNNVYDVVVTASDGSLSDTQALAITVTNVNEAPVIGDLSAADNQTTAASSTAVMIDQSPAAKVTDDSANFNGGYFKVTISSGRISGDILSITTNATVSLSSGMVVGSDVTVSGQTIGSIASNGTGADGNDLLLNLNASATPSLVSTLLQNISFDATSTAGNRVIDVIVNDGQYDSNTASTTIQVKTNPTVAITSDRNVLKAGETATISFNFNEAPIGFTDSDITVTGGLLSAVTVDSLDNKLYTATFTPTADTQSLSASISVAAGKFKNLDDEDNIASSPNASITGDTHYPTVSSINRQTPDTVTTHADSLTFAVNFSESVSGVDVSDFALATTGGASASIASVSGSGSSYTVTVDGTSGDGTIKLNLNSSGTGITDARGNAISGGFTTGQTYTLEQTKITNASYDASTGILTVTGQGMVEGETIDVKKLSITGQGGSYTLTSANVVTSSATEFSITLNTTDRLNSNGILNKTGTSSVGGTTYNLAGATLWNSTAGASADLTGNTITVTNVKSPSISSASYDVSTHVLTVSGSNLVKTIGNNNDITVSSLTLKGEGASSYTLTSSDVELTDGSTFSITLNTDDRAVVEPLFNKAGLQSTGGTSYNLSAADNWNSVIGNTNIEDLSNPITVSNVPVPTISSASYNAETGLLTVTGIGFSKYLGTNNDIDVRKLRIKGEGGATWSPSSSSDVEITSRTSFGVLLSNTDRDDLFRILNKNGEQSTSGTTYSLQALDDFDRGADSTLNLAGSEVALSVSNLPVPSISSATYDLRTGVLTVSGTGFSAKAGSSNDILAGKFTIKGENNVSYTLLESANVEITSGSKFSINLHATDAAALANILNKNGTSSRAGFTYNIAAAEDWNAGVDGSLTIVDTLNNPITVSGANLPPTTSNHLSSMAEDSVYTFSASDFNFADADSGDTLQAVMITSLPSVGSLKLNGNAVAMNQTITRADINSGLLSFTPVANAWGNNYANFNFKVSDGTELSATGATWSVNVSAVNDPTTGTVTITGKTNVGQTLTANPALDDIDGLGAFSYKWYSGDTLLRTANSPNYTLTSADIGKNIKVFVSYIDGSGFNGGMFSNSTIAITDNNKAPTGGVTFTGTNQVSPTSFSFYQGAVLTAANNINDLDGIAPGAISYQWRADTAPILGATNASYATTQADVGKNITVDAIYTDNQGNNERVKSTIATTIVDVNDAPTGSITINDTTPQVGQVLSMINTVADIDGIIAGSIWYEWFVGGLKVNRTNSTNYTVREVDLGKTIVAKMHYADPFLTDNVVASVATSAVAPKNTFALNTTNTKPFFSEFNLQEWGLSEFASNDFTHNSDIALDSFVSDQEFAISAIGTPIWPHDFV